MIEFKEYLKGHYSKIIAHNTACLQICDEDQAYENGYRRRVTICTLMNRFQYKLTEKKILFPSKLC